MTKKKTMNKKKTAKAARSTKKPAPKAKRTRRGGRAKGTKNHQTDQVVARASRCRNCDSTSREPYRSRQVQEYRGTLGDGQPFTHIVRRRTACSDCGQHRFDVYHMNAPHGLGSGEPELR